MSRFSTADQRAAARAEAQDGVISYDQALAAGLSADQIDHRCVLGAWVRAVVGVFVLAGSPDTPRRRARIAFLATAATGGVLSFITAAAIHGLLPVSMLPHVTVPRSASARCRAAKVHRGHVPAVDQTWRDAMRLTSVSRTIVDLASVLDRATLEEVVDVALCRKLASVESILAALRRAGRRVPGAQVLRSVLAVWSERIEPGSVAEVRVLRTLAELGVTGLVSQYEVFDEEGRFVARLDLADVDAKRALEYDGVEPHNPRAWRRDEARYEALRRLGWHVDAITKLDLLPGEPRLRRLTEELLCARPDAIRSNAHGTVQRTADPVRRAS